MDPVTRAARNARRRCPWLLGVGALFLLAGALYAAWAVRQLSDAGAPGDGFDRPIAAVARLTAVDEARLREVRPETPREERLLAALRARTDLTARLAVLVMRVIFSSAALTAGVLLLALGFGDLVWLRALGGAPPGRPSG